VSFRRSSSQPSPSGPRARSRALRRLREGEERRRRFQFCMQRFQSVGCLFLQLSHSCGPQSERMVSRAPVYHILWSRGFRATTISGRGFNLFKPLRCHFEATPFCRRAPARRDPGDRARCERLFRQSPNERRQRCLSSRRNPTRHCERSEAIQGRITRPLDCFVARAPRNDGRGISVQSIR